MKMTYEASLSASEQEIYDATFKSADEKFKALVAASERNGFEFSYHVSDYTDPFDLCDIEREIFGIDLDVIHGIRWAYERYIGFIGCVDAYFGDHIEQERKDHAQFFKGERVWCFCSAIGFMVHACGQDSTQSMAWVCKIVAAEIRGGLYNQTHDAVLTKDE
ncbi:MAG: hypothetical protein QM808_17695 [Steroidobacteraceae bacterium]